jgi:hypothetical protein
MGKINCVAFDAQDGRPTISVSGRPVDVADFLAIWEHNSTEGISLAQQLGVRLESSSEDADTE